MRSPTDKATSIFLCPFAYFREIFNLMKIISFIVISLLSNVVYTQVWEIEDLDIPMPEGVSNNAVTEGLLDGKMYVYSFGGIDNSKNHEGIHLKSFKLDLENSTWESIEPLPDDMGKIAAGASTIGDTIYIIGGYHVFPNGSELSSSKVHRFSISQNTFLADGMDIPIAIDDHVQCVYQNRYIYIITGWSNTTNVPNVQIYDCKTDDWLVGTSVPDNNAYKSFGASGAILGDTLYYFGGASFANSFPIQNVIRKTPLNSADPTDLEWSHAFYPEVGYRMASLATENKIHWIGGSNTTYNYNGIAYNGTGGVPPNRRILSANQENIFEDFTTHQNLDLPMDLRGIATLNDSTFLLAGGMEDDQLVSNKTLQISYHPSQLSNVEINKPLEWMIYPNPCTDKLHLNSSDIYHTLENIQILNVDGAVQKVQKAKNYIDVSSLVPGFYYLKTIHANKTYQSSFMKH